MKLPSYVTSLNLLAGLLAIVVAGYGHLDLAAILILAGVVFDALDGYVARKMHQESEFGAQLDSLADLVTFGVSPMILLIISYNTHWLSYLSVLIPFCGALRLARHNVIHNEIKGYLIGIPITTAGVVIPLVILSNASAGVAALAVIALAVGFMSTRRVNKLLK